MMPVASARAATPEPHRLQCLEVWGGTSAADEAVSVHGLDLYVFSRPFHGEPSGGDVYLVSMCGAGNIARIMLADVSGHGAGVSALGRSLRRLMRKHVTTVDQTRAVRELNREFTRQSSQGRFATAVVATYFAPTDHLIIVNAGHPPPLWYRADRASWELLEAPRPDSRAPAGSLRLAATDLPLGVVEPTPYVQFAVTLGRDDLVVLYTDALIEAPGPSGEPLGTEGLLDRVRGLDASAFEDLAGALRRLPERGGRGAWREDDLTLIVAHHNGANPPRHSLSERLRVVARMMGLGRVEGRPRTADPGDAE